MLPRHRRLYPPAETLIDSVDNYASGADLWNIALDSNGGPKQDAPDCTGCSGLVTIDGQHARLNVSYYGLAQMSAFVHRGAQRIAATRFVTDVPGQSAVRPGLDDPAFGRHGNDEAIVQVVEALNRVPRQLLAGEGAMPTP